MQRCRVCVWKVPLAGTLPWLGAKFCLTHLLSQPVTHNLRFHLTQTPDTKTNKERQRESEWMRVENSEKEWQDREDQNLDTVSRLNRSTTLQYGCVTPSMALLPAHVPGRTNSLPKHFSICPHRSTLRSVNYSRTASYLTAPQSCCKNNVLPVLQLYNNTTETFSTTFRYEHSSQNSLQGHHFPSVPFWRKTYLWPLPCQWVSGF